MTTLNQDVLTTAAAARSLGISSSTFKRLCERHNVTLGRTPGGHRRIARADLTRLSHELNFGTPISLEALSLPDTLKLLVEAKPNELFEVVWRESDEGLNLAYLLEQHIVPAIWKVGELWRRGQLSVAQQKATTVTIELVIDALIFKLPLRNYQATIVGGSFPPSLDTVASRLIVLLCRLANLRAIHLGCSCEPEFMAQAASSYGASAVWVSHTHVTDLPELVRQHSQLAQLLPENIPVFIGGGGLPPSVRRQLKPCRYYEFIDEMIDALCQISSETGPNL